MGCAIELPHEFAVREKEAFNDSLHTSKMIDASLFLQNASRMTNLHEWQIMLLVSDSTESLLPQECNTATIHLERVLRSPFIRTTARTCPCPLLALGS